MSKHGHCSPRLTPSRSCSRHDLTLPTRGHREGQSTHTTLFHAVEMDAVRSRDPVPAVTPSSPRRRTALHSPPARRAAPSPSTSVTVPCHPRARRVDDSFVKSAQHMCTPIRANPRTPGSVVAYFKLRVHGRLGRTCNVIALRPAGRMLQRVDCPNTTDICVPPFLPRYVRTPILPYSTSLTLSAAVVSTAHITQPRWL